MVAAVIARELGLELYQVDMAKMVSKWIGETERNLAELFDAAEAGQRFCCSTRRTRCSASAPT